LTDKALRLILLALVLLCGTAVRVVAQDAATDPFATARLRIGPFAATPSIALNNLGFDTNVFNSWNDPQGDFTFTATPAADAWLRLGKGRLSIHASVGYVYFAKYTTERGFNTDDNARLELPLTHFRPYAGFSYLNIRDRPGYEVDQRVRRSETGILGGVDVPFSRKTTCGLAYRTAKTVYAQGEQFSDTFLAYQLNRRTNVATARLRYALTPLTTVVLDAESVRERFEYASGRDSNGFRIMPGVEFGKFALINGSARVGFRNLKMLTPGMPDYAGVVAAVNLGYTLMGATRFAVTADRDVAYSFENQEPYYLLTGVTGTITQQVAGPWDVQARAGIQYLDYQRATCGSTTPCSPGLISGGGVGTTTGRTDVVRFYGGGVGYRLGPNVRLRLNADYYTRRSDFQIRAYEGLRVGTSVVYGF
jgi:hypothetical protein